MRSLATMDIGQARSEDKPSPVCEHAVPISRGQLLIRTIADTNMALWAFGRPGASIYKRFVRLTNSLGPRYLRFEYLESFVI